MKTYRRNFRTFLINTTINKVFNFTWILFKQAYWLFVRVWAALGLGPCKFIYVVKIKKKSLCFTTLKLTRHAVLVPPFWELVDWWVYGRGQLKCDGTRAETRFRLSAKRMSPFKSAGASVQSTTGSRCVRINFCCCSNAGYTMFRGSEKGTGCPLLSPVSPSLPLPCFTMCHHISTGVYYKLHKYATANAHRKQTSGIKTL